MLIVYSCNSIILLKLFRLYVTSLQEAKLLNQWHRYEEKSCKDSRILELHND